MVTRWDTWFGTENLANDERILAAPPSQCAESAAQAFLARGKRFILDLACGIARDTFFLASCGLTVTGVDAAGNGLRVAQRLKAERGAVSQFAMADARALPFGDGAFEGVYCFGLLHEFTGEHRKSDVERVMSEIKRVLCDEGILVLAVLAGAPEAGLPAVQFFTRQMFAEATRGFQEIALRDYDDIGCTSRTDYHVWCGVLEK